MDSEAKEIQQNELAALRAIFMDDFKDVVAKTAWNVKPDAPEFAIRVRPTDDELKDRVSVGLHVRLPKAYPRTAPQLSLEDGRGLSDAQMHAAQALVRRQADSLVGGEMVYELAIILSEHLTTNNSAAQMARPSFHQQMVDRERAGREADLERAEEFRRRRQRADAEEQQDLQRRIREELQRKQQQVRSDEKHQQHLGEIADAVHSVAGRWAEGIQLLRFAKPVFIDPQSASRGWFSTMALEEACTADALCTVFDAYPTDLEGASLHLADRFTVQCFTVTTRHYLTDQGRKQLGRIRSRVADLAQIRHDNMVTVYGSHMEVLQERSENPAVCLWVLSDPLLATGRSTLEDVLESCGSIGVRQTCTYLRHILLALVSLHAAGFIHRSIMPSNILLAKEGRGRFTAKLFNTSYREELIELHRMTPLSAAVGDSVGNDIRVAPEVVDRPDMMGRKNDIWCAGVVGLQMALGVDVLRGTATGNESQVLARHRNDVPPMLFGLLASMLATDHRTRPTAMEALGNPLFHQGLDGDMSSVHRQALDSASRGLTFDPRNTAQLAADPVAFFSVAQSNVDDGPGHKTRQPPHAPAKLIPPPPPAAAAAAARVRSEKAGLQRQGDSGSIGMERFMQPSASRYRTDFEELGFLGRGGFGSVAKARNQIDGRFYAIKKVTLDPRDTEGNKKIFREVTTLSRLHHQNVVRYYTTWVENVDSASDDDDDDNSNVDSRGSDNENAEDGDFGAHLSHSSWSTESESLGTDSSSSGYSSVDNADDDDMDGQRRTGDTRSDHKSLSTSDSGAGATSSSALDALDSHTGMLAQPAGSRVDVFSAIRFGTMGAGDAGARKRTRDAAAPKGPVREFAIEFTDSQPNSELSGSEEPSDSESYHRSRDVDLRDMLRRDQRKRDRLVRSTQALRPPRQRTARKRPEPRPPKQILYIQMEYCENKTLSDLLQEGVDEKQCWKLFAQILEGLQHIHQRGVIHRDLKPVNAFLDAAGDVKIGDFGLATSSFAQIDPHFRHMSLDKSTEDAMTADIGTAMYVAPEVIAASSGAVRYNQKVDMYSLGIIFFELCYPVRTGMERAAVLHGLRKPEIVFPADFPEDKMQLQYQIIRRLLSHNPRQRPSSAELLESGLLPPRMEDEHIYETIRAIANPSQPYFAKLMDSLFARSPDKHIDATFDYRSNDIQSEQLNAVFLDRIRELMARVFRTHAAVELSTPAVMPKADLLGIHQKPALYVDPRGNVVQLAYDQTVPFARYVARTKMTEIKRYCFDRYFVANAAGGQPIRCSAASFDAVTNRSAHAVAAAEVVSVACEVFNELPAFSGTPTVLIMNHMCVLDAILAYCGILHPEWWTGSERGHAGGNVESAAEWARPEDQQRHAQFVPSVCVCLASCAYREKVQSLRQRIQIMGTTMGVRVHPQSLDRLQLFMGIRGDLGAVQREVLARIGSSCGAATTPHMVRGTAYAQSAIRAFGELRYVEAAIRQFGVAVPLVYVPLFSHNYAYYEGGYAFQIMTDRPAARRQPAPQVLAVGGRYDGLLRRFRHLAGSELVDADAAASMDAGFAKRTGSLHSTGVWQQMFSEDGIPASPPKGSNSGGDGGSVAIGNQLSLGSAALGTARDVVCVGVQIQLDFVIQEMARYQQQVLSATMSAPTFGLWTRKRCDVVVASFGTHPMLRQRIALARELWASRLRTDFLYNDDPEMTMERLVDICRDQGMNWIVTLKRRAGSTTPSGAGGSGDGLLSAARYVFKVKNILRRVESEVPHDALCEWLHADIAEQYRIDLQTHDHRGIFPGSGGGARGDSTGAAAGAADGGGPAAAVAAVTATDAAPTTTTPAGGGSAGGRGGGRLEVVVVDPQRKARHLNRTRHKQKTGLADRASAAVARVMADVRGAPVLAIDEGAEFVRRLAGEPSILSDNGYKRMTELSSAHHRAYIAELHTLLERYQRDGCTHVWLYAAKGDLAITYKL